MKSHEFGCSYLLIRSISDTEIVNLKCKRPKMCCVHQLLNSKKEIQQLRSVRMSGACIVLDSWSCLRICVIFLIRYRRISHATLKCSNCSYHFTIHRYHHILLDSLLRYTWYVVAEFCCESSVSKQQHLYPGSIALISQEMFNVDVGVTMNTRTISVLHYVSIVAVAVRRYGWVAIGQDCPCSSPP